MDKVRQFEQRAKECWELARKTSNIDIQVHYENLARAWDKLAEDQKLRIVEN